MFGVWYSYFIFIFHRKSLKALISKLNDEKKVIKKFGIKVDGILHKIKFVGKTSLYNLHELHIFLSHDGLLLYSAVTVDYKALLLLVVKEDDEDFVLGKQGLDVEFCIFCQAVRVIKFNAINIFQSPCPQQMHSLYVIDTTYLFIMIFKFKACKKHLPNGRIEETCLTCLQSKANIGKYVYFKLLTTNLILIVPI